MRLRLPATPKLPRGVAPARWLVVFGLSAGTSLALAQSSLGSLGSLGSLTYDSLEASQEQPVTLGLLQSQGPAAGMAELARAETDDFLPDGNPPTAVLTGELAGAVRNDGLMRAARLMWTGRAMSEQLLADLEAGSSASSASSDSSDATSQAATQGSHDPAGILRAGRP